MDSLSEARLQLVHPLLAAKVRQMAEMLELEKIIFRVTEGLRTWAQQDLLYQQGRTLPGKKVTNAPAGSSWHNFGMAADLCPNDVTRPDGTFVPDWNPAHPVWLRLINVGTSLGLESGAKWRTFKDYPHFQLTGRFPVTPDLEVHQLFAHAGISEVWKQSGLEEINV